MVKGCFKISLALSGDEKGVSFVTEASPCL